MSLMFLRPLGMLKSFFSEMVKVHEARVFLSFGENCLTDEILKRHGVKSFSTPYSSARSNIEYILQIEKDRFRDFVNPQYLVYEYIEKDRVVRLKRYDRLENHYNVMQMNGFEFTHHDVLSEADTRKMIMRRAHRMLKLKNKELNIFYHNRMGSGIDEELLLRHLGELKTIYESRCRSVNVIMFTQTLVDHDAQRRVEHLVKGGIHVYRFYVRNEWGGTDPEIFWARCDDDLIATMMEDVRSGKIGIHA